MELVANNSGVDAGLVGEGLQQQQSSTPANELGSRKKSAKKRDRSPAVVVAEEPPPPSKKEKQRPETWNKADQQIFFNALRQNGKNFESITQYFNARQKRFVHFLGWKKHLFLLKSESD